MIFESIKKVFQASFSIKGQRIKIWLVILLFLSICLFGYETYTLQNGQNTSIIQPMFEFIKITPESPISDDGDENSTPSKKKPNTDTPSTNGGTNGLPPGSTSTDEDGNIQTFLGNFRWTYYYITYEEDFSGPQDTPVLDWQTGATIALVRSDFFDDVSIEGTGYLTDGRMINLYGPCPFDPDTFCFFEVDIIQFPYGVGWNDNPLHPFISVASDHSVIAPNTHLYIPVLDGKTMPNGYNHNGCVIVEDSGYGFSGNHLDFFAQKESYYHSVSAMLGNTDYVDVYSNPSKCN